MTGLDEGTSRAEWAYMCQEATLSFSSWSVSSHQASQVALVVKTPPASAGDAREMWVQGLALVAQTVQNLPAMWETWVRPLGRVDPLEEGMAPTPVFLPGESHGQRSLVGYSSSGCTESDTTAST